MSSHTPIPATAAPAAVAVDENNVVDDSVNINLPNRWFFEKDKLEATPSRKCGIDPDKELTYRQQSANFIQDIGQRLQVNQLCINTAIVYMHRFYMFHSFSHFHRNAVSTASIFLAAKVEEQPRKLEHVIKVAHYCLHRETQPQIDVKSEQYAEQSSELVMNENVLLQTLGFDVAIDHPHTHVVKCCQLVRASKDLAQTSYFMATNSLHLTTMCLQYKPTVVACVCIHLACKWSNWEIPRSKEGKDWFWYVDDTVTTEQLESMTTEFLTIFNKSPSRLKKKMMSLNQVSGGANLSLSSFPTHMSIDPTSPGAPNFPKSRSPSPAGSTKRVNPMKPSGSQQFIAGKSSKPHGMPPSAAPHGMKHHGPPGSSSTNKHVHPSATKPPYHQHQHGFPIHSAKDSHQQLQQPTQSKDGIVHGKHPNAPPHHSHGAPPYPHPSGRQNAQSHHSQSHSGQKPLPPGSHPPNVGYSSKIPPPHPSKVPHTMSMAKPSVPGSSSNKNPTSSSGSYPPPAKKIYPEGYVSKEDLLNRRSNSGQPHPPQSRPRPPDKPDVRHHPSSGPGGQLSNSVHPTHLADHSSRTWIDHTSAFATEPSSSGRNDKSNPALVGANKTSASNDYYQSQRHRPDNLGEKRTSASNSNNGGIPNSLTSSAVVDRNDNVNVKTETMDDQFNQIASKVNANSYYPSALNNTSVSMNIDISGNASLSKSKQIPGGVPLMSSLADVAGFIKNEDDLNLSSVATITPIPDVSKASNKRRHEGPGDMRNSTTLKRARSDGHATLTSSGMQIFPTYTANTEDLATDKKPIPSKTSPSHAMTRENRRSNNLSAFTKGLTNRNDSTVVDGGSGVFGNDLQCDATGKLDLSSALSMELQPPVLLAPFGESHHPPLMAKSRGSSLFSPTSDAPPSGLINSIKGEGASSGISAKSASGAGSLKPVSNNAAYFSMNSGVGMNNNSAHNGAAVSITNNYADAGLVPDGTSSGASVPIIAVVTNEPSGSDHHKKSKKSKKEKHKHKDKHKDKEERKHKKDKHREKDREKHRSRDKRKSVDSVVVESVIENKPTACKLKISLGSGGGTSSAVEKHPKEKESKSKHSSSSKRASDEFVEDSGSSSRSKMSSSSMKPTVAGTLKVKIVKERVKSADEDHHPGKRNLPSRGEQHSQGQSTPCCPGFGPCTNPNCNQGQAPIRVKIPKEKIIAASASTRPPKESKEPKKSKKEKEPKVKERTALPTPIVNSKSAVGRGNSSTASNHGHKNGVEKVSRKRESASSL